MTAAETDIDWMTASEDDRLIEACRAAASVAAQFETVRRREARGRRTFADIFRQLRVAARSAASA